MTAYLTFDYAAAWREVAKPAYLGLPQDCRDLLVAVAEQAADLHQLPDLSMPWPEDSDLKVRFGKIPAEWLSKAAAVIHRIGHWYPGAEDLIIPGRSHGAHWKFAHYADQSLRERLGLPPRGSEREPFQILEGAIRLCYSSRNMWTWIEVAPATQRGLEHARTLQADLQKALAGISRNDTRIQDHAAWEWFEARKTARSGFPLDWHSLVNTSVYMRPEQEIKAAQVKAQTPEDRQKRILSLQAATAKKIRELEIERDGKVWFLERGIADDNLIYYSHTGIFTFGWREPVTEAIKSQILDVVSEFPYPYAIKCADGRTLEGGKE